MLNMKNIDNIIQKQELSRDDIIYLLSLEGQEMNRLFEHSARIKKEHVGNKVYFRGLIEFSNICSKNCLYCGIRQSNPTVKRYRLTGEQVLSAAGIAYENNYGSVVLQSGEMKSDNFIHYVEKLLTDIGRLTQGKLRVTLSCGEQEEETYRRWFESGAHRYLLRIESSNPGLYKKLHPNDGNHTYQSRLDCLYALQRTGYQVGTGVMIGLPFQTIEDLADDLLFMKDLDVDMAGMGPYLEHENTPFSLYYNRLIPKEKRFQLSLKMIAVLRILMKDINIAAATALQAIHKFGREKGIMIGANVIMPNITPSEYRNDYLLYDGKPCTEENAEDCNTCLAARISITNHEIAHGEWGDSKHFRAKNKNTKP